AWQRPMMRYHRPHADSATRASAAIVSSARLRLPFFGGGTGAVALGLISVVMGCSPGWQRGEGEAYRTRGRRRARGPARPRPAAGARATVPAAGRAAATDAA